MNKDDLNSFKHIKHIPLRYDDLDTMGHVNNKAYLAFLEEARIDFHQKVFGLSDMMKFSMVVAKIEINYMRPVLYGDNLYAYSKLNKLGNTSFEILTWFVIKKSETEYIKVSDANVVLVNINTKTGKSVPIDETEKEKLMAYK